MIDYKMPYDFILPYEGSDIFKELKNANRHIFISHTDEVEGFQIAVRQRRHKSDVPRMYL